MSYGFSAYNRSSEIYFAKYINSIVLRPDGDKQLPNLRDINFEYNPSTDAMRSDPNSVKFTLPSHIISHFKSNNIKPNFIPFASNPVCTCVLNYAELYKSIDSWNGWSGITFYVRILPVSTTAFYQYIQRSGYGEKVGASMIVGFKE